MKTVPQRLSDLGAIYEDRNEAYGDSYHSFGNVMEALFPTGMSLGSAEEWSRFGVFMQIVGKVARYANAFEKGHIDTLDDISVYSQMLQELDQISRERAARDLERVREKVGGAPRR